MIASLRGKIISKGLNRLIVEACGVGYDLAVSLSTQEALQPDSEVFLLVHTMFRENALELYGFATAEEKKLFELLLTVAGIGPKSALAVLSGISPQGFRRAVIDQDLGRLTAIPGIGKKSAERIVLELKDKIRKIPTTAQSVPGQPEVTSMEDDLISSLINLGYNPRAAETMARKTLKGCQDGITLTQAVRAALKDASKH